MRILFSFRLCTYLFAFLSHLRCYKCRRLIVGWKKGTEPLSVGYCLALSACYVLCGIFVALWMTRRESQRTLLPLVNLVEKNATYSKIHKWNILQHVDTVKSYILLKRKSLFKLF